MYNELGFNKSLGISIIIHILIIIILSIILQKNPFELESKPLIVTIQSESESISTGLDKKIEEARKKSVPVLKERITKSLERTPIEEKLLPKKEIAKANIPPDDIVKKTIKETHSEVPVKEIKKEIVKEDKTKSLTTKEDSNLKKVLEELPEKKEVKQVEQDTKKIPEQSVEQKREKEEISKRENLMENEEIKKMSDDIDKILDEESKKIDEGLDSVGKSDPLSDASWSSKPRKTLFFPNISDKIPEKYRKKGIGYSITAKLVFDKNGLVIKADIIRSSGEIEIDNIFSKELRKIRVEPIKENRFDEITKEFIISVK